MHPNYLDIMCCLVLIFLLTSLLADTSKRMQEQNLPPIGLPELSANSAAAASASKALILTVKPGPVYFAGETTVKLPVLAAAIRSIQPSEVEIRGDASSPYLDVMNAMQACREAGVAQVALTYQVKD